MRKDVAIPPNDMDVKVFAHFARNDFYLFVQMVFLILKPNTPFIHTFHIEAMCASLMNMAFGPYPEDDNRLAITLPPRMGKSTVCSVAWPLFLLGRSPAETIISITYGEELTRAFSEDRRRVLRSPLFKKVFPKLRIVRNTALEIRTRKGGFILGTTVKGALTGRGANHFIIDDPIKAADIFSTARREEVNGWFQSTLASRPDNKLRYTMLLVMQRLHVDDPAGVLLRTGYWTHLNLPAIAVRDRTYRLLNRKTHLRLAGTALSPDMEPLRLLLERKETMGNAAFSAQYQQEPVPPEGGIFHMKFFQNYDQAPALLPTDVILQSWDTAFTENESSDFSVGTTWLVRGDQYFLMDVVRGRYGFLALTGAILAGRRRFPGAHVIIEHCGSGISVIQALKAHNLHAIAHRVTTDKVARAHQATPVLDAQRIMLPSKAPWLDDFCNEIASFPGNSSHDDQVDSMVQAINYWEGKRREPTTLFGSY